MTFLSDHIFHQLKLFVFNEVALSSLAFLIGELPQENSHVSFLGDLSTEIR